MNILTLGFYDKSNHGDETYKDTFRQLFPNHQFEFTNQLNDKLISNNDLILLGGGNVLRNEYVKELKKIKNKPIYAYSVGIEDNCTEDLSIFKHIYTRDLKSLNKISSLNIPCTWIPDAAFILKGNPQNGKQIIETIFKQQQLELYNQVVVVVINGYIMSSSQDALSRDCFNFIKFSYDFAKIIDETPASFIFIPFGNKPPHDDRVANSWVASKCKFWKKNHVIFEQQTYQEVLDIIAYANLTISSRLHSSIFSYIAGTPFIDITHHSKNENFIKMIEKENNSISFYHFDNRIMKNKINELISQPKHEEFVKFKNLVIERTNEIHFN